MDLMSRKLIPILVNTLSQQKLYLLETLHEGKVYKFQTEYKQNQCFRVAYLLKHKSSFTPIIKKIYFIKDI